MSNNLDVKAQEIDWKFPPRGFEVVMNSNGLNQIFYFSNGKKFRAKMNSKIFLGFMLTGAYKLVIEIEGNEFKYQKRSCPSGAKYIKKGTEEKFVVLNCYDKID